MSSPEWAWDPARGDHYRVLLNPNRTYTYIYAKDSPSAAASAPVSSSSYRAPQAGTSDDDDRIEASTTSNPRAHRESSRIKTVKWTPIDPKKKREVQDELAQRRFSK
ncbi:hypothetical protein M011DRAFT_472758 [Sporormia fimetaria CBS 119925]|uniref:Uncharacterized protein n=1 Tax=Sporormia fimetaria CBS 119925 TaxID=1340428 RepID=A0A6A6UU35_9PLEO|nr:hypothetical protein M011DRAFT_472758 [Sporormia fimetaria CBS 119925]